MTVFTYIGYENSVEEVAKAYQESLGEVVLHCEEKGGMYQYTLHDSSILSLFIPEQGKTAESFEEQRGEWMSFYKNVQTSHQKIQKCLLQEIPKWSIMVQISFQETENEDRTACLFGSTLETAENMKGFVLLEDMTLLNSQADVVLDADGDSDLSSFPLFD